MGEEKSSAENSKVMMSSLSLKVSEFLSNNEISAKEFCSLPEFSLYIFRPVNAMGGMKVLFLIRPGSK